MSYRLLRRAAFVLLALALALNAGCALALIGAAAAGAAGAGYIYYNGYATREFHAPLADTREAVNATLADLQFPVVKESTGAGTASIQTRTADGYTVWISLDVVPSPVPAEGAYPRVSIRVGVTGDEKVSRTFLDQVASRLTPTGPPPPVPPTVPLKAEVGPPLPPTENPDKTPAPPIATTPTGKTTKK
jgi:hypothetical protein